MAARHRRRRGVPAGLGWDALVPPPPSAAGPPPGRGRSAWPCAAPTPARSARRRRRRQRAGQVARRARRAAFHRAEDDTLTLEAEELPAGFPNFAARRERPVTWTLMVRQGFAQAATKTYYLEGRKDYEGFRGRTDIGQIRTTGHVFVQLTAARETDRRRGRPQ